MTDIDPNNGSIDSNKGSSEKSASFDIRSTISEIMGSVQSLMLLHWRQTRCACGFILGSNLA